KGIKRKINVTAGVRDLKIGGASEAEALQVAGIVGDLLSFSVRVPLSSDGAVRSREIVEALCEKDLPFVALRRDLRAKGHGLLELAPHRKAPRPLPVESAVSL